MYSSTFLWLALFKGRGPNFTISFVYCMARAASKAGAGPVSVGKLMFTGSAGAGVEAG